MFKFDPLAKVRKWLTASKDVSTEGKWFADAKSIKDLYDAIKWKTHNSYQDTSFHDLPSSYNELYVYAYDTQTTLKMGTSIPNGVTGTIVINGYCLNSSFYGSLAIQINSSNQIKINEYIANGANKTSTTTLTVLYR